MASSLRLLSSRCVLSAKSGPIAILPASTRSLFAPSSASISLFEYDAAFEDDLDEPEYTNITSTDSKTSTVSLSEFISSLPPILHEQKRFEHTSPNHRSFMENLRGTASDPVTKLFSRLYLSPNEIRNSAILDPSVKYTRSLVATDDATFSLLLLCWNPNTESPIHDHPCDGCWVRVCDGVVKETRYEVDERKDCLVVTSEEIFDNRKGVSYINDAMGYHKVANPSKTSPAVSMHLYSPPYDNCKIWLDPRHASMPSIGNITYHNI